MRLLHVLLAASLALLAFSFAPTASACSTQTVGEPPAYVVAGYGTDPSCEHATVEKCSFRFDPNVGEIFWFCAPVASV